MTFNLRHSLYASIHSSIALASSSYGASSNPTIYGGFPDLGDIKNPISFPAIIIEPLQTRMDSLTVDSTRNVANKTTSVVIHIFAKNNKDLDYISDGISDTVLNTQFSGFSFIDMQDANSFVQANNQKIKAKTLTLTYLSR